MCYTKDMDQPLPPKKRHLGCWIVGALFALVVCLAVGFFVKEFVSYYRAIKSGDLNPRLDRQLQSTGSTLKANSQVTDADLQRLHRTDRPSMGSQNPKLTIVEFLDFGCPYCQQSVPVVRKIVTEHQDEVRLIFRDFPVVELHPQAMQAAIAARCAFKQDKYVPYHDKLYVNQDKQEESDLFGYARELNLNLDTFTTCYRDPSTEQEVNQDLYDGLAVGVQGTPTFFFNGVRVQGALDEDALGYLVDEFMKKLETK